MIGALGIAVSYFVATDIAVLAEALHSEADRVVLDSGTATAAFVAVAIGLLLILIGRRWSPRASKILFAAFMACLPMMLIAPVALRTILGYHLERAGYTKCNRSVVGNRRATPWVKPGGRCEVSAIKGA